MNTYLIYSSYTMKLKHLNSIKKSLLPEDVAKIVCSYCF